MEGGEAGRVCVGDKKGPFIYEWNEPQREVMQKRKVHHNVPGSSLTVAP